MKVNWLLIVVAVILIWNMISGYRRGLVNVLYRFVSSILSVVLSLVLVLALSDTIRNVLPFYSVLESWASGIVTNTDTGNTIVDLVLSGDFLGEEIAHQLSLAIFNIILFIIIFIIVRIILSRIGRLLNRVSNVPVLGKLNRFAGIIAGFVHGLLNTWLLFAFFEVISGTAIGTSALQCMNANAFLSVIANSNPIWNAVALFLI